MWEPRLFFLYEMWNCRYPPGNSGYPPPTIHRARVFVCGNRLRRWCGDAKIDSVQCLILLNCIWAAVLPVDAKSIREMCMREENKKRLRWSNKFNKYRPAMCGKCCSNDVETRHKMRSANNNLRNFFFAASAGGMLHRRVRTKSISQFYGRLSLFNFRYLYSSVSTPTAHVALMSFRHRSLTSYLIWPIATLAQMRIVHCTKSKKVFLHYPDQCRKI